MRKELFVQFAAIKIFEGNKAIGKGEPYTKYGKNGLVNIQKSYTNFSDIVADIHKLMPVFSADVNDYFYDSINISTFTYLPNGQMLLMKIDVVVISHKSEACTIAGELTPTIANEFNIPIMNSETAATIYG